MFTSKFYPLLISNHLHTMAKRYDITLCVHATGVPRFDEVTSYFIHYLIYISFYTYYIAVLLLLTHQCSRCTSHTPRHWVCFTRGFCLAVAISFAGSAALAEVCALLSTILVGNAAATAQRDVLGGGYNYTIRLQFDRATTIRRPTSRSGCCTAASINK